MDQPAAACALAMVVYWVLHFAASYFFVPLLAGWLVISTAGEGRMQKVVGWSLVALGAWGAVSGIPHWWTVASRSWQAKAHMDQQCKRAAEQLPARRLPAEGVLVVQDRGLQARVDAEKLVQPGRGRFQRVQEQRPDGKGGVLTADYRWVPDMHGNLGHVGRSTLPEPTLPYELSIRSVTTSADRRHGVEGIDVAVIERSTGAEIARRLQYVQWSGGTSMGMRTPSRVCPEAPKEEGHCTSAPHCAFGWTLAFRALQPEVTLPPSQLFHLYRGMPAPRRMGCLLAGALLVGPGIQPEDVEWWSGDDEFAGSLHLRLRGSRDELVCTHLFSSGGPTTALPVRFADGREVLTNTLFSRYQKQPTLQPQPLVP